MTNATTKKSQRVRFEEVTPTNEIVAYFDAQLSALFAGTGLPLWSGYDDLDNIQFAYITLPSGNIVVLGQYENAPEIGVDLYIEFDPKNNSSTIAANIPALVVETLRYLAIPRATAVWFHPDYETEIERLYSQAGEFEIIPKIQIPELTLSTEYEPIDCFYYALEIIYPREKLPEYWAMLQHNLGLAYFDRINGKRWENLQKSIACFNKSLEVFDRDKYPQKWQINQEDLIQSQEAWDVEKQNLIKDILERATTHRKLTGVDLSHANLSKAILKSSDLCYANLSYTDLNNANLLDANLSSANLNGANLFMCILNDAMLCSANLSGASLSSANLTDADLSDANLSHANLSGSYLRGADLSDADLSGANVDNAKFGDNEGISESMKKELMARGAVFEDSSGDRSQSQSLVPR
jgi:uncharacterized protein YjbI with pentapeptide repeats